MPFVKTHSHGNKIAGRLRLYAGGGWEPCEKRLSTRKAMSIPQMSLSAFYGVEDGEKGVLIPVDVFVTFSLSDRSYSSQNQNTVFFL